MKDNKKVWRLLGVGLDSELAQRAVAAGFNLTKLRGASKRELAQYFSDEEVDSIWKLVKREPIPAETLQRLVEECDWKCCVCWNYRKESPIIIHHIEEYSTTQDNRYDNLAILCPNHHAKAHSISRLSRPPLPPELIRTKKREWIEALAKFKAGRGAAPGDEVKDRFTFVDLLGYLSDYISTFLATLSSPRHMDEIMQREYELPIPPAKTGGAQFISPIVSKIPPKLLGFVSLSIIIGSILQSIVPNRPPMPELLTLIVVVNAMWLVLSWLVCLLSKLLGIRAGFVRMMSVCLQIISVVHVTASLASLVVGVLTGYKIWTYFLCQTVLLAFYLPFGLSSLSAPCTSNFLRVLWITLLSILVLLFTGFGLVFTAMTGVIVRSPETERMPVTRPTRTPVVGPAPTSSATPTPTSSATPTPTPSTTPTPTPSATPTPTPTPTPICDDSMIDTIYRANKAQQEYMLGSLPSDRLVDTWGDGAEKAIHEADKMMTYDTEIMKVIRLVDVDFDIQCRAVETPAENQAVVIMEEHWRYQAELKCKPSGTIQLSWLIETYPEVEYHLVWQGDGWHIRRWGIGKTTDRIPWKCP